VVVVTRIENPCDTEQNTAMAFSLNRRPRSIHRKGFPMNIVRPPSSRKPKRQTRPYRTRLRVECLEDRLVPSHAANSTGLPDWKVAGLDPAGSIAHAAHRHGTGDQTLLTAVNEAEPRGTTAPRRAPGRSGWRPTRRWCCWRG